MPLPLLVTTLLSQGLGLLGNAVLAKGQDVIEEKLGISLEQASKTEEGLFKLKQLEMQHEEFLLDSAMEETKLYLQDVDSARKMAGTLSHSTSWLNQNIMPILALLTMIGSSLLLILSTESDVKMAAVSFITMVLGFFFGSSKGSKDKQELLTKYEAGDHK